MWKFPWTSVLLRLVERREVAESFNVPAPGSQVLKREPQGECWEEKSSPKSVVAKGFLEKGFLKSSPKRPSQRACWISPLGTQKPIFFLTNYNFFHKKHTQNVKNRNMAHEKRNISLLLATFCRPRLLFLGFWLCFGEENVLSLMKSIDF